MVVKIDFGWVEWKTKITSAWELRMLVTERMDGSLGEKEKETVED